MMEIKKVLKKLHSSSKFMDWQKDHKECFLAHIFKMFDKENEKSWQVGYCNPKNDIITTFIIEPDSVLVTEESEPFKKPGTHIHELNLKKVDIDYGEALEKAEILKREKYPKEIPLKKFFILQNIKDKNMYNITYFTSSFKAVNIKIGSDNGSIVNDEVTEFLQFKK